MIKAVYALAIAKLLLDKLSRERSKRVIENYVAMKIISKEDADNVIRFMEMLPESQRKKEEELQYSDHIKLIILCAYLTENVDFVKNLSYHKSIIDVVLTKDLEKTLGF